MLSLSSSLFFVSFVGGSCWLGPFFSWWCLACCACCAGWLGAGVCCSLSLFLFCVSFVSFVRLSPARFGPGGGGGCGGGGPGSRAGSAGAPALGVWGRLRLWASRCCVGRLRLCVARLRAGFSRWVVLRHLGPVCASLALRAFGLGPSRCSLAAVVASCFLGLWGVFGLVGSASPRTLCARALRARRSLSRVLRGLLAGPF